MNIWGGGGGGGDSHVTDAIAKMSIVMVVHRPELWMLQLLPVPPPPPTYPQIPSSEKLYLVKCGRIERERERKGGWGGGGKH